MCNILSAETRCLVEVAHGVTCNDWRRRKSPHTGPERGGTGLPRHDGFPGARDGDLGIETVPSLIAQYLVPCDNTSCTLYNDIVEKHSMDTWVIHKNWPRNLCDASIAYRVGMMPLREVSSGDEAFDLHNDGLPSLHILAPCRTHQLMLALIACSAQGLGVPNNDDSFVRVDYLHPDEVPVVPWLETAMDTMGGPAAGRVNAVFERPWRCGHDVVYPLKTHACGSQLDDSLRARQHLIGPLYRRRIPDFWGFDPTTKEPLHTLYSMPDPACLISPRLTADVIMAVADHLAKPRILSPHTAGLTGTMHALLLVDHDHHLNVRSDDLATSFSPDIQLDPSVANRKALEYRSTRKLPMPVFLVDRIRQLTALTDAVVWNQMMATGSLLLRRHVETSAECTGAEVSLSKLLTGDDQTPLPYADPFENCLVK